MNVNPSRNIVFREVLSSTMEVAKELIPEMNGKPFGVVGGQQLQGRGSSGRSWNSPKGNMHFTIALPYNSPKAAFFKEELLPVLPLTVGLGCRKAIADLLPKIAAVLPGLKWPNDIVYDHKKMGGSIIEPFESEGLNSTSYHLIGIGLNVHFAPPVNDDGREAVCLNTVLKDAGASAVEPMAVAELVWDALFSIISPSSPFTRESVVQAFEEAMDRSLTLFHRTANGRGTVPLTPVGLNEWGHLIVRHPDGTEEVLSHEYLF